MQKWEYCTIHGLGNKKTSFPHYYRLTDKGFEPVTDFRKRPKGVSEADAVGHLIAQLGDEGWEMVGAGNVSESYHCLYFKRSKS